MKGFGALRLSVPSATDAEEVSHTFKWVLGVGGAWTPIPSLWSDTVMSQCHDPIGWWAESKRVSRALIESQQEGDKQRKHVFMNC